MNSSDWKSWNPACLSDSSLHDHLLGRYDKFHIRGLRISTSHSSQGFTPISRLDASWTHAVRCRSSSASKVQLIHLVKAWMGEVVEEKTRGIEGGGWEGGEWREEGLID